MKLFLFLFSWQKIEASLLLNVGEYYFHPLDFQIFGYDFDVLSWTIFF